MQRHVERIHEENQTEKTKKEKSRKKRKKKKSKKQKRKSTKKRQGKMRIRVFSVRSFNDEDAPQRNGLTVSWNCTYRDPTHERHCRMAWHQSFSATTRGSCDSFASQQTDRQSFPSDSAHRSDGKQVHTHTLVMTQGIVDNNECKKNFF